MEQTHEIEIGSIHDIHTGFRAYARLTPKQYITDKHVLHFRAFMRDRYSHVPEGYHDRLFYVIQDHAQWQDSEMFTVRVNDGNGVYPNLVFTV